MMTCKEIARNTLTEIAAHCEIADAHIHWVGKAEGFVFEGFQVARDCRRDVLTFARALHTEAPSFGISFAHGVDMAISGALEDWARFGYFKPAEQKRYDAACMAAYMGQ